MIREIMGKRVKEERNRLGLPIEEFAHQIGLSRQTLSKIEKGETTIDADKLMIVSEITNKPLSYFYDTAISEVRLFFRADAPQEIDDELLFRFKQKYRHYSELEEILAVDRLRPIPRYFHVDSFEKNKKEIADIAEEERKHLGAGEAPIKNIFELLEQNGIKILFFKSSVKDLYGLSAYEEGKGACIFVNSNKDVTVERRIFTAAHEYAHLIFHRDEFNQIECFRYRRGKGRAKPRAEKIADYFAGHLLVPPITLENAIPNKKNITGNDILYLKKFFGVSFQAVVRRLKDVGYLSADEERNYYRQLARLGYREKEPEPMEDVFSRNLRYIALIKNAYENEKITLSKVAELLDITALQAREKILEWSRHS